MPTYYVRPDGNNTNPGTGPAANQAWATLSKAATTVVAGDIVYVAPGTYREQISLTNAGSVGNTIKFIGDPRLQYFGAGVGLTIGEVILSGLNAESDQTITRTIALNVSGKNYIEFTDLTCENFSQSVVGGGTNCVYTRITAIKNIGNIMGKVLACPANNTYNQCTIIGKGNLIELTGLSNAFNRCLLKIIGSPGQGYGLLFNPIGNGYTITFNDCVIEAAWYNASTYSYSATLNGCKIKFREGNTAYHAVKLNPNQNIIMSGCDVDFGGAYYGMYCLSGGGACEVRGSKLKNTSNATIAMEQNTSVYLDYVEIQDGYFGIMYSPLSAQAFTITGAYIKNCVTAVSHGANGTLTLNNCMFYANSAITSGVVTNNTPSYGEAESIAGAFVSAVSPISGTKSLKSSGWRNYAPVFVAWIACEAGKAKTIKFKIKKSSTGATPVAYFGDQSVSPVDNTNVQELSMTYTHHKTELVPLFLTTRLPNANNNNFAQYDDISA